MSAASPAVTETKQVPRCPFFIEQLQDSSFQPLNGGGARETLLYFETKGDQVRESQPAAQG